MREIKKRSCVPVYGAAVVWALYCLIFPLYKLSHFIVLILLVAAVYGMLSKLFPGTVEKVEIPKEPVSTGDEKIDALLKEGETAVGELKRLRGSITSPSVRAKIDELIPITEKIFADLYEDPSDYRQVKRFSDYYLPKTIKLLNAYDRMSSQGVAGENISGTMDRIESILDTAILAYKKQLDALFADQALDIDTDITVLESMLKREGFSGKDF